MRRRGCLYCISDSERRELLGVLAARGITNYSFEVYMKLPFNALTRCSRRGTFTYEMKEKVKDLIKNFDSDNSRKTWNEIMEVVKGKKRQAIQNKQDGFVPLTSDHQAELNYLINKYHAITQIPDFGVSITTLHRIVKGSYQRINQTISDKLHSFYLKQVEEDNRRQVKFDFGEEFESPDPSTQTTVDEGERKLGVRKSVEGQPEGQETPKDRIKKPITEKETESVWSPRSLDEAFVILKMKMDNGAGIKELLEMTREISKRF